MLYNFLDISCSCAYFKTLFFRETQHQNFLIKTIHFNTTILSLTSEKAPNEGFICFFSHGFWNLRQEDLLLRQIFFPIQTTLSESGWRRVHLERRIYYILILIRGEWCVYNHMTHHHKVKSKRITMSFFLKIKLYY